MTRLRDGLYVWVTWLAKLMAGEVTCQWAPWFRAHYTGYARVPSDFQLAAWNAEHTQLLDEVARERVALGEGVCREDQNQFRARRPSGLCIAGKPDLIAVSKAGYATVYDAKTGRPRHSDIIQVMLYMMCLPYASPLYKGKTLRGCVAYKNGQKSEIPKEAIDEAFRKNVTYFLDLIEAAESPRRAPSARECRFCDITLADCPERVDVGFAEEIGEEEPEIPL